MDLPKYGILDRVGSDAALISARDLKRACVACPANAFITRGKSVRVNMCKRGSTVYPAVCSRFDIPKRA